MNAEEFVSGYVKGSDLPPGFRKRMRVAAVSSAGFDDGRKLVVFLDEFCGRGVPLNQTRLRAMIEGCGHDTEHWVGREVDIFHATAFYQGKQVAAVGIAVVERPAVAAPMSQPRIAKATFTSSVQTVAPTAADEPLDYPAGQAPFDDDVPF